MVCLIGGWCVYSPGLIAQRLISGSQGTSEKSAFCETCGLSSVDCVGHYAYIKLCVPVFHIGFFKHTIAALQSICKVSRALQCLTPWLTKRK